MKYRWIIVLLAAGGLAAPAQNTDSASRRPRKAYTRYLDMEQVEHDPVVDEKPGEPVRKEEPEVSSFFDRETPSGGGAAAPFHTEPATPILPPGDREMEDWKRSLVEDIVRRNSTSDVNRDRREEEESGWGWLSDDARRFQEEREVRSEEDMQHNWIDLNVPSPFSLFGDEEETDDRTGSREGDDAAEGSPDRGRHGSAVAYSREAELENLENSEENENVSFLYIEEDRHPLTGPFDYTLADRETEEEQNGLIPLSSEDEAWTDKVSGPEEAPWASVDRRREPNPKTIPRPEDNRADGLDFDNRRSGMAWEAMRGSAQTDEDDFSGLFPERVREENTDSDAAAPPPDHRETTIGRFHNALRNEEAASREWERKWR